MRDSFIFYRSFYDRLENVIRTREELKTTFRQLSDTLKDISATPPEPDAAGGGIGKAGPSGPGVK